MQHTNEKGKRVTHYKRSPTPRRRAIGRCGALAAAPSNRRAARALACIAGALGLVGMGLFPAGAGAGQVRLFAGTFGAAASTPANPYPLEENVQSVAVDGSSHDVYVSDANNARVEKFDSSGHFILMFGKAINKTKVKAAAPEAEQNLCTAASGDECQAGERFSTKTPVGEPGYLAVDNSSGPSQGDVYVSTTEENPAGLVDKFDSSGHLIASWASAGQFDGSTATSPPAPIAGPFGPIGGIAVDTSGNLWVGTLSAPHEVFEFRQDASFVTDWQYFEIGRGAFALDSEDNVYLGSGVISKYNATGNVIGVVAPSKAEANAGQFIDVVVDPSNNELYGGYREGGFGGNGLTSIRRYESSCHPVITDETPQPGCAFAETFGAGLLPEKIYGLAIDPSTAAHTLYVAEKKEVASFSIETVPDVVTTKPVNATQSSATLNGTVEPGGVPTTHCFFEWGTTTSYGNGAKCEQGEVLAGSGKDQVSAKIVGLTSGATYHYRLVASNANDVNGSIDQPSFGQDLTFGPPVIERASVLEASATETVLQAQLDPNDLATRVRIEYGTEAGAYTRSMPEVNVDAAGAGQTATFELTGLEPGVTYHYRVVAENVLGEGAEAAIGPDQTFATQPVGSFSLLDGRAWELVSPPNKHGASIESIGEVGVVQAAAGGEAVSYLANAPTEATAAGNDNAQVQVLSTRSGGGWSSVDIATPHERASGHDAGPGPEYKFFSPDLSLAIVEPNGGFVPSVSSEASEKSPYLRTDFPAGDPASFCTSSCYRPLVSGKPGFENVPSGTEFGEENNHCYVGIFCGPKFLGASPDASHIVLASAGASLTEGAPQGSLYEWSAGHLRLISIFPGVSGPAPANSSNFGSSANNLYDHDTRNAISLNGSRVVWSESEPGRVSHLYLRDLESEETLQVDHNKGGSGKGTAEPLFQDASSDDSTIFFTDTQQLTPGSGASTGKQDLYRCQVVTGEESGELECALTDLTPANGSEGANVQGAIPGASKDGSFVYFFADGVLAHNQVDNGAGVEEAKPANCEASSVGKGTGECNLYQYHGGTTTFIASLSSAAAYDWLGRLSGQPTRVSPNGEWFEFMSQRPLTAYDSRDATTGKPVAEAYLYSAASNRVVCASCDPSGARPHGVEFNVLDHGIVGGYNVTWITEGLVAATVPGSNGINGGVAGYQDRYLSDSGRLFFNATDALVPKDSNGTVDVYEYEPPGVGDCSQASGTFSARSDGCVDLISSGRSGLESVFLDASENGNDAFFLTAAQLSYRDTDSTYDVYDARVGGGETEPVKPIECLGDACQGFVEAPNDPTPDSLTFQGPGNLLTPVVSPASTHSTPKKATKCAKGKKLVKGKCVKSKAKRKKAKKARRANHNRGAKR